MKNRNIKSAEELAAEVSSLQSMGYVAMPTHELLGDAVKIEDPAWNGVLNRVERSITPVSSEFSPMGGMTTGRRPMESNGGEDIVLGNIGTKGYGYMKWGTSNRLPNDVSLLASLLPYTALGIKYNQDVLAGLGPRPKYRYSYYSNGALMTKEIDFGDAGEFLKGKLIEAQAQLSGFYSYCREQRIELEDEEDDDMDDMHGSDEGVIVNTATVKTEEDAVQPDNEPMKVSDAEKNINSELEEELKKDIEKAKENYRKWEETDKEVRAFLINNNLNLNILKMAGDMANVGMAFPELQLSRDTDVADTQQWRPKVTGIGYRSALTCRLERMDLFNRINYVYVSNKWLDDVDCKELKAEDVLAFPALDPEHPVSSLRELVRNTRMRAYYGKTDRNNKPVRERPTRVIFPSGYCTTGRPYYPQPAWWSIFNDVYRYTSTLIRDRAIAKDNSNMWGKIIYIHTDYLTQLFTQMKAVEEKERAAIRESIVKTTTNFLKEKSNNGKTMVSFTFTNPKGETVDAIKIVDVPTSTKSESQANQTELEEISSIIFFALEVHPDLIGAIPGRKGSNGGTDKRELYELKKIQMKPTQQILLKSYEVASQFNEWDEHLVWRIQEMSLVTTDKNATGVQETKV